MRCSFSWTAGESPRRLGHFALPHQARHHLGPPHLPIGAPLGGVIAEDADVRRVEQLAQLDGPLELFQVGLERLVDADLADGRADGAEAEAVPVEQGLELADLQVAEGQDVGPQDRAKLDVTDAARVEHVELLLRVWRDFVREGADREHGIVISSVMLGAKRRSAARWGLFGAGNFFGAGSPIGGRWTGGPPTPTADAIVPARSARWSRHAQC